MSINTPYPALPAEATDCHMHVYDSRYPAAAGATLLPPDAPLPAYLERRAALGLSRTVVVQPSTYGMDNRCTLAARAALGEQGRAVIAVAPDSDAASLEHMNAHGVRGLRFGLAPGSAWGPQAVADLGRTAASLGWHVQLTVSARRLASMEPLLAALRCPLVVDHMGNIAPDEGVSHAGFATLRRLIDAGRTWVKLSGAYLQATSPASFDAAQALAAAFVAHAPQRLLWGSNWPHPTHTDHPPDDRTLLNSMLAAAGSETVVRCILVDNPAQVYGFAKGSTA